MSTTRFVTFEMVGGEKHDLLHVLLWCKALQVGVYQGFTIVQAVRQGEKNVNLKEEQNYLVFEDQTNLKWVQL